MIDFAREAFAEALEYHRLMHTHLLAFRARLYAIEMAHDPEIRRLIDETVREATEHGALSDALPADEFVQKLRDELVH